MKMFICCWFTPLIPGKIRLAGTVICNNNFGSQGKLLWKFGSSEGVRKPLMRRICSTGWCAGLRICMLRLWIYNGQHAASLLCTETALCCRRQPSDLSNSTHAHTTLWLGSDVEKSFSRWYASISVYSLGACTHPTRCQSCHSWPCQSL